MSGIMKFSEVDLRLGCSEGLVSPKPTVPPTSLTAQTDGVADIAIGLELPFGPGLTNVG